MVHGRRRPFIIGRGPALLLELCLRGLCRNFVRKSPPRATRTIDSRTIRYDTNGPCNLCPSVHAWRGLLVCGRVTELPLLLHSAPFIARKRMFLLSRRCLHKVKASSKNTVALGQQSKQQWRLPTAACVEVHSSSSWQRRQKTLTRCKSGMR
jgi:hypothetical protein